MGPWHISEILPSVLAAALGDTAPLEGTTMPGDSCERQDISNGRGAAAGPPVRPAVVPRPWCAEDWHAEGWARASAAALCGQPG